jgi:hypothetical protein
MAQRLLKEDRKVVDTYGKEWMRRLRKEPMWELLDDVRSYEKGKLISMHSDAVIAWYIERVKDEIALREIGV